MQGAILAGSQGQIDLDGELRACAGLGVAPVFVRCGTKAVQLGALGAVSTKGLHQRIGERGEVTPRLVRAHRVGAGADGKQVELLSR